MEDQCLLSKSSTVSTVEFVLNHPEEARGHLPLVPNSVGLPKWCVWEGWSGLKVRPSLC